MRRNKTTEMKKESLDLKNLKEACDIELKSSINSFPKDACKTYSAFANTNGGLLVLGMVEKDEAFIIEGVSNPERVKKEMFDLLSNKSKVSKCLIRDENVKEVDSEGKKVILVDIPAASYKDKPIYLDDNPNHTYIRKSSGDYLCEKDIVQTMIRDAQPTSHDSTIINNFTMDDLDKSTIIAYRNRFNIIKPSHPFNDLNDMHFLKKIGCLGKDRNDESLRPTLGGLLVFGKYASIREIIPHFHLEYIDKIGVGVDYERWRDRVIYDGTWGEGNLYNFFNLVISKLFITIRSNFSISDDRIHRTDESSFHIAIREAFVNSIIHADYKITGSIKIYRYDDKFVFINPGTLRITKQDFFKGDHSEPRNHFIQEIFRHINLCERAGTGIPKIMEATKKYHLINPELKTEDQQVDFTISDISILESATDLNEIEKDVLSLFYKEKILKRIELEKKTNLKKHESIPILNSLIQKEYIRKMGNGKGTMYRVNDGVKEKNDFIKYNILNSVASILEELKRNI